MFKLILIYNNKYHWKGRRLIREAQVIDENPWPEELKSVKNFLNVSGTNNSLTVVSVWH